MVLDKGGWSARPAPIWPGFAPRVNLAAGLAGFHNAGDLPGAAPRRVWRCGTKEGA
jgi:hypothetical protein